MTHEEFTIPHSRNNSPPHTYALWALTVLLVIIQKVYLSGLDFNQFNVCVYEFLLADMANAYQLWSPAVQDLLSAIYDWVIGNYIIYIATDDTRYRLFGFWGFHMTQCGFYSFIALNNIVKN